MPLFKKSILSVGTHQSPDGEIKVTPKRLRHWAQTFARMKRSNLKVPSDWDHSDDPKKAVPLDFGDPKQKRSAQNAVGLLHSFKLAPNGRSAELTVDLRDSKAIEHADENIVEISPVIFDQWKDGRGRVWDDCITHVDLVTHPVDATQTPFTRVPDEQHAIACSLRMGLQAGKPETFRMATKPAKTATKPAKRMATDEPEKKKPEDEPEKKPEGEESEEGGGEEECLKRVLALLKEFGIGTPEGVSADDFLEKLEASLTGAKAMKEKLDAENDEDDMGDDEAAGQPTESSPAFAAMSLKANAAHQFAEKQYRLGIANRLKKLRDNGQCTPAEYEAREKSGKQVRLSLNAQTNEPEVSELERWIESREPVPAGTFWSEEENAKRMSRAVETRPDRELTGEDLTEDEAEDLVDDIFRVPKDKRKSAKK
jgi:hypothetical protein